jgi:4-hydroxy-3-methylbut-2-enyl diphosphate reductase
MITVKRMRIVTIQPHGFCGGVVRAIRIVERALADENTIKPIYMLGNIVHNKHVVRAFQEKGIIVLDGLSRDVMLEQIEEGTIIITAHGASDKIKSRAREKGLNIIDATCACVEKTHALVKEKLYQGYAVYYYGKKNHPETEGVLGISPAIILVTGADDIKALPAYAGKAVLTNQTTMSYNEVRRLHEKMRLKIPQLELVDEVCDATRRRQEAVIAQKGEIDLLIVVGDPLSNNTRMLEETAEKNGIKAIQIEDESDLDKYDFSGYETIGVTAGASTPETIIDNVIASLKAR